MHNINDAIHKSEPLLPERSCFGVEIAIDNLKSYKSPSINQIPAETVQAGGNTFCSEFHKLINSIRNKEELLQH
jgi:hypothetical protein